jgi:hypothetical protein
MDIVFAMCCIPIVNIFKESVFQEFGEDGAIELTEQQAV